MKKLPEITKIALACCGCGACKASCPTYCISIKSDSCGFIRPVVDEKTCIGCNKCDKVCPALNEAEKIIPKHVLWAASRNDEEKARSSSGGLFALLASCVLKEGGIVVGAAWADDCNVVEHIIVDDARDLDRIMRSKYVQSDLKEDIFRSVQAALREKRKVLFSGTACQVAGMNKFLGEDAKEPFYLAVDVICHGVPSPKLWKMWKQYQENINQTSVRSVNFRNKSTGWSSYSVSFEFGATQADILVGSATVYSDDWYMRAFLNNASLRDSCFNCPAKLSCGSDITLGDFWGIGSAHPDVASEKGISAVMLNTEKGLKQWRVIADSVECGDSSFEKVVRGNPCLEISVSPYFDRRRFMDDVASGVSIPEMMDRWNFSPTIRSRIVSLINRIIKQA